MAKTILGIDIGVSTLKLVLVNGTKVKKLAIADVPDRLIKNSRVVSREAFAELLKTTMRKNGIHAKEAALVIPGELVYESTVTMPQMTAEQLLINLPYEFRDYITDEPSNYLFDYAMLSTPEQLAAEAKRAAGRKEGEENGEEDAFGGAPTMELHAVAVTKELMEEMRDCLHKAGLKLVNAAPSSCAYLPLLNLMRGEKGKEVAILDMGQSSIRLYIYSGNRHEVTRVIETGLRALEEAVADSMNVDIHLAHTYVQSNYENCQASEACTRIYDSIAVDVMRALNFYRFSNPGSTLADLWLAGGGGANPRLVETMENTLADLVVHNADELVDGKTDENEATHYLQAMGMAMAQ